MASISSRLAGWEPSWVRTRVSAVVSSPHPTMSSICLVEWGSGKTWPAKNSRKPR